MDKIKKYEFKDVLFFITLLMYIFCSYFVSKIGNKVIIILWVFIPIVLISYDMYRYVIEHRYKRTFLILLSDLSVITTILITVIISNKPLDITNVADVITRNNLMNIIRFIFLIILIISTYLKSDRFKNDGSKAGSLIRKRNNAD